ncbi:DNase I-like protein [Lentinus tigrinus ALCF2SS1-7]|uniref:DNase I-like protein n=1 Tax=Lentinus tigrinus ALCF2SS1-6 TaxID=1328759 RepID=A0A5C2SEQ5_9APHY|nr:DNase I-like protein [Lentinus tigrinus ALCF2SS1-6]RPD78002.1 DNase I-like protein [Lentinus tigrinus ALCF2SS1-7]
MMHWGLAKGAVFAALLQLVRAVTVTDIQGASWLSPLKGQTVHNLSGIVTAKSTSGFWIQGEPVADVRVSNGLSIFTSSKTILASVNVGDNITLSGVASEFRSSSSPNNLFITELQSPANITVLSSNNTVIPLVLGPSGTRSPPTQKLSARDDAAGADGWLAVPNNQSLVEVVDATLQPDVYGMDFWSSLEGQLVTVKSPVAIDFENDFGEFWVYGDWEVTGKNSRGGLSITFGPDGAPDANPETVIVGSPLDGTDNPSVSLGKTFEDITGVIVYQFGFYYILPLTAPVVASTPSSVIPPATIKPTDDECTLVIGDYNVENMAPTSSHMSTVANHIANFLNTPDIMFVQEIQDNSGATDNGVVIANLTLTNLVTAVANAGNASSTYSFLEIAPENDTDGGQPGGNIRQAYLFNSTKFALVPGSPAGGALDATEPIVGTDGKVTLTFNPGRIDPTNAAWNASRKPLVAAWETPSGARFFTVNLHLTAKLDGSSTQGDARPPVNGGVDQRIAQVETVAAFVQDLLALDPDANVIVGGDCNEYVQTRAVFAPFAGLLTELDEASGVPDVERYTYLFDQNSQQLDHLFVSSAIVERGTGVEHVHVNNWAASVDARASDHDPSVAEVKIC